MKKIKKMRIRLLFLQCLVILVGCSSNNIVNVTIEDVNGLKEGSSVICKGKEIGNVADIQLVGRALNVKLELQKDFQVPKGSELSLVSVDLIGTRAISIKMGEGPGYFTATDTLDCIDRSATKLDSTIMHINDAIDEIKDSIPKLLNQ